MDKKTSSTSYVPKLSSKSAYNDQIFQRAIDAVLHGLVFVEICHFFGGRRSGSLEKLDAPVGVTTKQKIWMKPKQLSFC